MDQIDAFPEHISTTVMPVTLPEKTDALVYAARQGHVRACILYQEPNTKRVFVLFCKDNWHQKKTLLDNFKRAILEAKHVNEFRPDDVLWEKISKGMLRNPDRLLKNTDKRMDAPQLLENGFHLGDFRQRKRFDQKAYKLPPPTPAHVPAETHKRPLEQQPKPLSKKKRVIITPIIRPSVPSVRIIKPSTALSTPQPVSIPDPSPEQTTSQILLPDPPVVETTSQIHLPDPPEQTTSQILLPDPPEQTTSEIHLPDPPESTTSNQILFYQIHHLIRQHLRFIYQNHHLIRQHLRFIYQNQMWSRRWSRPLRMTLP
ncbi:uncharacterized protein TNCV_882161 [Trichonephila clavipes]|nr:uncharacterized protein TNCV_882161 [Trichonephila clavipes]